MARRTGTLMLLIEIALDGTPWTAFNPDGEVRQVNNDSSGGAWMRSAKMALWVVVSCVVLSSCATTRRPDAIAPLVAPMKGFVPEVDEPTTRGQLTLVTPTDMFVSWRFVLSPDNRSVVFSARRIDTEDPYQLFRLDLGSGALVKITSGGETDAWDPSFTPDGEQLVYRTAQSFWKVRRDGSGAKMKLSGSGLNRDYYPRVSSKERIAFVTYSTPDVGAQTDRRYVGEQPVVLSPESKYVIWTIGLDGSDLTQYREGNFPAWSPDGSLIAFEYKEDIWLMNTNGGDLTQLTSTRDIGEFLPSFSPDGRYIVYVSNEGPNGKPGDDPNIWYMGTDGTSKTQVTELRSWDSWPFWGKDGIYFLSGRAKGERPVQRIWRINVDIP